MTTHVTSVDVGGGRAGGTSRVADRGADLATESRYDDPRITAMGLLAETVGGLNARFTTQFAEHDLSAAEFEALLRLGRTPGGSLRMSDLATQTLLTTSGITRVVDRLERAGLVERRACPTDRRGLFAQVTRAGRERLEAVLPGHVELIDTWLTGLLTPGQLDALLAGLRVVRDAVRPDATAGVSTTNGVTAGLSTTTGPR